MCYCFRVITRKSARPSTLFFIYYILFTAEQLQLNPEYFKLEVLGAIQEDDEYYKIAYKYVRNISLFDVTDIRNSYTEEQNRQHFILLHS